MTYFIKRIYYTLTYRSKWLLLALFPPLVFIMMSAITPDRFMVSQDLMATTGAGLSPSLIYSTVSSGIFRENGSEKHMILRPSETRELYFLVPTGSSVRIVYEGDNLANGSALVAHYYNRLQRNLTKLENDGALDISHITTQPISTERLRSVWRPERTRSLLQYAAISLLLVVAVLVFVEFIDPSFKSVRTTARYLGVPVLGSLPNAGPLLQHMNEPQIPVKSKLGVFEEPSTTS
jgi:hypothetical protein